MSWHFLSCWCPRHSVWCKGWQHWCHIGEHTAFPPKSECIFEWSPQTRFSCLRAPTTSLGQPCSSLLTWIWPRTIHTQFRLSRVKRLLGRVLMLLRSHPLGRGTDNGSIPTTNPAVVPPESDRPGQQLLQDLLTGLRWPTCISPYLGRPKISWISFPPYVYNHGKVLNLDNLFNE